MSPVLIPRHWMALPAAVLALLVFGAAAPAQATKPRPSYCSPCDHPFFGYYGTCWRPFPPGWVPCPCDPPHGVAAAGAETIPGRPRPVNGTKNGGEPEPIPAPKPDPGPVSQGRLLLMRLWGGSR